LFVRLWCCWDPTTPCHPPPPSTTTIHPLSAMEFAEARMGEVVPIHVNQVQIASWRDMFRLMASRVVFGLQTIIRGVGTRTVDTAFKSCHLRAIVCSVQFVHRGIGFRCCSNLV
jgi:hypothetical protein